VAVTDKFFKRANEGVTMVARNTSRPWRGGERGWDIPEQLAIEHERGLRED